MMSSTEIRQEIARIEGLIAQEKRSTAPIISFEWHTRLQNLRHELAQRAHREPKYRIMPKGTPVKSGDGFLTGDTFVPFIVRRDNEFPSDRAFLRPVD